MKSGKGRTAVVLGGTVPHGELIKELKERGFFTVLVDYFENPPAAQYADIHCRESAMDYEAVLRIAKEYQAELILSSCLDQQINIAMKAAEELGLRHPFSSETALKVTDKRLMKKIMMDHGIPTARYYIADEETDLKTFRLTAPVIVKPVDSCGSAGVSKFDTFDEEGIKTAVRKASGFGSSGKVVVEEFIEGTEMGVHGYVADGKAHILFGTCKISIIDGAILKQLCNLYIPRLRTDLREQLERIADQIVAAFGLPPDTPLFLQTIVRGDEVFVIEFSPRVAGGTTSSVAKEYAGFDLLSYSIDSYTGAHETKTDGVGLKRYVCNFPLYAREGIFDRVTGAEQLLADGTARHAMLQKSPGDHISGSKPSAANVLKYLIDGSTYDECFEKLMKADAQTDILDADGRSMRSGHSELTHELFLEKLRRLI